MVYIDSLYSTLHLKKHNHAAGGSGHGIVKKSKKILLLPKGRNGESSSIVGGGAHGKGAANGGGGGGGVGGGGGSSNSNSRRVLLHQQQKVGEAFRIPTALQGNFGNFTASQAASNSANANVNSAASMSLPSTSLEMATDSQTRLQQQQLQQQQQQQIQMMMPTFNPLNFSTIPLNRQYLTSEQILQLEQYQLNNQGMMGMMGGMGMMGAGGAAAKIPPNSSRKPKVERVLSDVSPPGVEIYEATYGGIEVYEMVIDGNYLMRRKKKGFVNATHILKVANIESSKITRILMKDVNVSRFDSVHGGVARYQGKWVPIDDARSIASQFGVLELCSPILNIDIQN